MSGIVRATIVALFSFALASCSVPTGNQPIEQASVASMEVVQPVSLEVEGRTNPIGVDNQTPRFSWHAQVDSQAAYEIQVARSVRQLEAGSSDLWESGRVADGRSVAISYAGAPLASREKAHWRVRVWPDGQEQPGPWSKIASWQMGLMAQSDWSAQWITSPLFPAADMSPGMESWLKATAADPQFRDPERVADTTRKLRDVRPATYFRKSFTVDRPVKSALLYSTSAGYSEFFLSGQKIGDRVLNPAQTDFDKRIYYDVDDLTSSLTLGDHVLGVHLGNGFYGERTAFGMDKLFYGEPAAIAQLEILYEDGTSETIISDASWRAHPSPILKNGVYSGEVFDARKMVAGWSTADRADASQWRAAKVLDQSPTQALVAAEMPPVRRVTEVKPKAIFNPSKGVWTIDFGQNFTGLPTVDVSRLGLEEGQTVLFRYAEWADKEGAVGMKSGGGAPRTKQVDAYISDGVDAAQWSPSFTWHGFRYMEVSGIDNAPPLDAFTGHLTRTDIERIGHFHSSSDHLNRIHETALWSIEGNLVSVLSDCPIRERNGWTGDAHAVVRTASYNYDFAPFLEKYLGDFRTTEMVSPAIVPGRRTHSGKIDWAAAEVFLTWEHYLHSSDVSVIERQYESLLEYVAYVENVVENDLVTNEKHFYGDWCDTLPTVGGTRPLGRCMSVHTPGPLTASALILRVYSQMAQMAALTGHEADAARFAARRDAMRSAFNTAFFDEAAGSYGSQTGNAMALSFGIVPSGLESRVAGWLEKDVRETWDGHHSVGALGQPWLYPALSDYGHGDTALGVFTAPGSPGYSYLFDELQGTTLWEDVTLFVPGKDAEPRRSLNHPFKAGYDAWFYTGLGGINPDPENPGYKHFFLRPVFPKDLDEATVSLKTGYGSIHSAWKREQDAIVWDIEIPENTMATVSLAGLSSDGVKVAPGKHSYRLTSAGAWEPSS